MSNAMKIPSLLLSNSPAGILDPKGPIFKKLLKYDRLNLPNRSDILRIPEIPHLWIAARTVKDPESSELRKPRHISCIVSHHE